MNCARPIFAACVLAFALSSAFALAAENSSSVRTQAELKGDVSASSPAEDVDLLITNSRMRAETGSKSKYSIASSLSYSSGSLRTPFSNDRPNLSAATGTTDLTSFGGAVSGKFALTAQTSVFAGVGLRWLAPFNGPSTPDGYNGSKFDVDNPYLTYQFLYRWAQVQSALTLNETFYSNVNLTRAGYVTGWTLAQNNVMDLGASGFTLGINLYVNAGLFNNNTPEAKANQSDYAFGVVPALEYRLSSRLNLRSDSNPISFQHVRAQSRASTYQQQRLTQSLALGWAVTRDIYFYPGFQWIVEDIRLDRTITWLSANINVF